VSSAISAEGTAVTTHDERPLVLHVVHSLAVGGLENGVVNLINRMSAARWRHGILALSEIDEQFRRRIRRDDVVFESLRKPPGHLAKIYPRVYSTLRRLQPTIVHTRNFGALEVQVPAWAAGVPARIHGEHGWDVNDPDGTRARYRWGRRLYLPFVHRYVAVSAHLRNYLVDAVGVNSSKVEHLCNGVDTTRFLPAHQGRRSPIPGCPFNAASFCLVGTVGRLREVKDQTNLARAFVHALRRDPTARENLRLVIVGDGPLRTPIQTILRDAGMEQFAWLAGERGDIPEVLRGLDVFVLPSLAEGISNTILEAMACGLPVIATRVGGNVELVEHGVTGTLVPAGNSQALGEAILVYAHQRALLQQHGATGRQYAEQRFSLDGMVARYEALYARTLGERGATLLASGTS
jgi:sugar transferase (PEP-CTERM/EpsH1 system associated)